MLSTHALKRIHTQSTKVYTTSLTIDTVLAMPLCVPIVRPSNALIPCGCAQFRCDVCSQRATNAIALLRIIKHCRLQTNWSFIFGSKEKDNAKAKTDRMVEKKNNREVHWNNHNGWASSWVVWAARAALTSDHYCYAKSIACVCKDAEICEYERYKSPIHLSMYV